MIELGKEDTVSETPTNDFEIKSRSISGDVHSERRGAPVPPATAAQFIEATDAVLSVPGVHAVRWEAYTPSWNDGEPCEYTVHDLAIKLTPLEDESDDRGDYEDGFIDSWSISYGWERGEYSELTDDTFKALEKALKEWESLAKEEVCRQNFGDHAQITATVDGFSVDYYDHD